jgi:HEAT repeat protein
MLDPSMAGAAPHADDLLIDLALLEGELQAEAAADPLDLLLETAEEPPESAELREALCQGALLQLQGDHDQQLQALKVFCEHRYPRAVPLLLPLLRSSCPILRMSAVYALGRNPEPQALPELQRLFQEDSNGFVRKALAWSLGNYNDVSVLPPLVRALETDIAAVRLWAASSLAEAGSTGPAKADPAAAQLLLSLRIDTEPAVRSNSAWALGRLYPDLVEPRQQVLVESLLHAMLNDTESSVRDEARLALEQLEQPEVLERLQTLVDEGLLA